MTAVLVADERFGKRAYPKGTRVEAVERGPDGKWTIEVRMPGEPVIRVIGVPGESLVEEGKEASA